MDLPAAFSRLTLLMKVHKNAPVFSAFSRMVLQACALYNGIDPLDLFQSGCGESHLFRRRILYESDQTHSN